MFNQIRTSRENKEIVAQLTRKLNLGTENIIARMAFSYSISQDRKLNLNDQLDSGGKEYSRSVLFGDYDDIYIGLLCTHYSIYKTDKDLGRYIKLHIDDGLQLINEELHKVNNIDGFDFLVELISYNLGN
ncbi:DndE family protein [uncultured Chryseobacterium sp.]|uniref:DndE family protein n=1 Tax=uncultured Chryseobacterium sp. TaxID=259322 RepID=UPI0025EC07E4|nr:DndE family protein [uncultured Chryseobacterium sp.]